MFSLNKFNASSLSLFLADAVCDLSLISPICTWTVEHGSETFSSLSPLSTISLVESSLFGQKVTCENILPLFQVWDFKGKSNCVSFTNMITRRIHSTVLLGEQIYCSAICTVVAYYEEASHCVNEDADQLMMTTVSSRGNNDGNICNIYFGLVLFFLLLIAFRKRVRQTRMKDEVNSGKERRSEIRKRKKYKRNKLQGAHQAEIQIKPSGQMMERKKRWDKSSLCVRPLQFSKGRWAHLFRILHRPVM